MQPELREATVKKLFKEALVETLHEQRELLHDVLVEVLEDTALAAAVRQGRQTERTTRDAVFRALEDRESIRITVRDAPVKDRCSDGVDTQG